MILFSCFLLLMFLIFYYFPAPWSSIHCSLVGWFGLTDPFLLACWCGSGKPKVDAFTTFLDALDDLPLHWRVNDKQVALKFLIVADAPARSLLKCTVGHNGRRGCERCRCVGKKRCFPVGTGYFHFRLTNHWLKLWSIFFITLIIQRSKNEITCYLNYKDSAMPGFYNNF